MNDGSSVGTTLGDTEGDTVGNRDGCWLNGEFEVGPAVGLVGEIEDGFKEGYPVGKRGAFVGLRFSDGTNDGAKDGSSVGNALGDSVGTAVGKREGC